jgi:transposase InsO family protein
MISAPDRIRAIELIDEACRAGARCAPACEALGLSVRSYQRWRRQGDATGDRRPHAPKPPQPHALTPEEQREILDVCFSEQFADAPPAKIVARLLDEEGRYIASESSMYRVLHRHGAQHPRGRAAAPVRQHRPRSYAARAPRAVWSWDVTWLGGPARGVFYYLFMIVDLYSRKIVGWEIFEAESAAAASEVLQRAVLAEQCVNRPLVLHADNGSPMKGATLLETMRRLQIEPSFSRPRVSNDNAYSEALFRTCKYVPGFPTGGFESLTAARAWVGDFVRWYNHQHLHSALRYVTPVDRHEGRDADILAKRADLVHRARENHPRRWSGQIRDLTPVGEVWLNRDREVAETTTKQAA